MSQAGIIDVEQSHPQIPTQFVTDVGTAIPIGNVLEILATTVSAHSIPLETTGSGNTVTIVSQYASAAASSLGTNAGFASFNSTEFTVDANGFVSLSGSGAGETITGDNAVALSPTLGNWNILGTSTAAGTTPVQTFGSVSTLIVQVQKSQAIASTNASNVGLSAFNSSQFSVDANGFVTLNSTALGVLTVSGTLNRITSTGGQNPVIDISASYLGQSSITTLGTISTGVWQGTAVGPTFGGTGQTTYTTGDILYASASNTLSKLAATTNGFVLTLAAGIPSWAAAASGTVTSVSGTTNRITVTPSSPNPVVDIAATYIGQSSITTLGTITTGVWNGTAVTVPFGGTGDTSFTAYSVICGGTTSTGALQNVSGVGTSGQVLTSSGAGALPVWANSEGLSAWTDEATNFSAVAGNGYFITANATATMPASPSQGQTIAFAVDAAVTTLTITANTGQVIRIGAAVSASAGTATNNARGDSVTLVFRSADNAWIGISVIGTWTVT